MTSTRLLAKVSGSSRNLRLLATSFASVATSRPMPDWPTYRALVLAEDAVVRSRCFSVESLIQQLQVRPLCPRGNLADLVSVLVSFVDDHNEPIPEECFPRAETLRLLELIQNASSHEHKPLDVTGQFALALTVCADPWTALLACHFATRQLARGRDTRVLGRTWALDVKKRYAAGRAIAPFPPELSIGGDPLGDTYHYWANVLAAVGSQSMGRALARHLVPGLFYAGPHLMLWIRQRTFRSRLFFGTHERIDRLGLEHGLALHQACAPS